MNLSDMTANQRQSIFSAEENKLSWWPRLVRRYFSTSQEIPDMLWFNTLQHFPFLASHNDRNEADQMRLRHLSGQFLRHKEFSGASGLTVTDEMAVAIAAQACLPVLHLGLKLYDDFKGIVIHPGAMLARREVTDAAGVVHSYREALIGEAMVGGPVTLSWHDVATSGQSADLGCNVVIHEFVHKIDMRDGTANGCPPLPSRAMRQSWRAVMSSAYQDFQESVAMAERFGGEPPWLDSYAAHSPAEFFAVVSEAYFVNRVRFTQDFAHLTALLDTFFVNTGPDAR